MPHMVQQYIMDPTEDGLRELGTVLTAHQWDKCLALKHTTEVSAFAVTGTNRVVRVGGVGLSAQKHLPSTRLHWVSSWLVFVTLVLTSDQIRGNCPSALQTHR